MDVQTFILGFQTAVICAIPYVLWRYAYIPFKVMRRDLAALAAKQTETDTVVASNHEWVKQEIGLRKAAALSNEELASQEMKLRARRLWPSTGA